jgi:hypothetical protein
LACSRRGVLARWPDPAAQLVGWADRLRSAYAELARQLPAGRIGRPVAAPAAERDAAEQVHDMIENGENSPEVLRLVEVDVWLADVAGHLARVQSHSDSRHCQRAG